MQILYAKRFKKGYKDLSQHLRGKVDNRLRLLVQDEHFSPLRMHVLHGVYKGYKSIDVTGDLRLIYKKEKDLITVFAVGTHTQLYE